MLIAAANPARAADTEVKISNFTFNPPQVAVKAGSTVVWTNDNNIPHTVTSTTLAFKSAALNTDNKFSFTFTTPGTYKYFCSLHPHMTGTIGRGGGDRAKDAAGTRAGIDMTAGGGSEGGGDKAQRFRAPALPYLDNVYTLARYLLRNAGDAEDAAQECYLRAFRHFETFRGGPIKPWLFAILRNVCRAAYAGNAGPVLRAKARAAEDCRPSGLARGRRSPEQARCSGYEFCHRAPPDRQLPDQFREAIVLRKINDLSYREIADCVEAPVGTVMSRLARARGLLRGAWIAAKAGGTAMTCEEANILLHALIDGELDAGHAREVEAHIVTCPAAPPRLPNSRSCTKRSPARPALHRPAAAPAHRRQIAAPDASADRAGARRSRALRSAPGQRDRCVRLAADGDARRRRTAHSGRGGVGASALAAGAASDRCAVERPAHGEAVVQRQARRRPAGGGPDRAGFTLLGGRLDYVDAKPVAAIVYRRRVHIVDLFCAPTPGSENHAAKTESLQGFNMRRWSDKGLNYGRSAILPPTNSPSSARNSRPR